MQHYKIKVVDRDLKKYKIYLRGLFRYNEIDGVIYDTFEDAMEALTKSLNGLHVMIHIEG